MSIVSIGEVVGDVKGGTSLAEQPPAEQIHAPEAGKPGATYVDELERELKARAWRRARLHAD
jgi:hypothetical protein